ncbi:MAG: alanine--tRNA ligase, partial [Anaerovoracaceae bacterium]
DCKPGCECDRYLEFWNHVFSQFDRQEDGTYKPMAHPNIDTGMGLERMACIMQGVDSIFDIDTIRHILNGVVDLCGIPYESGNHKADDSIRIITDHIRSIVFMIADGIKPSNEGRGYVLRRLTRRAIRHGRMLGIQGSFLSGLVDLVIEVSGDAYPEIVEKESYIKKTISSEEDKFEQTLDQGNSIINGYIDDMKAAGTTVLDGESVFKLYDTYGFPVELTQEILADYGFTADMDGFSECMQRQKEMARNGRKDISGEAWKKDSIAKDLPQTVFTGYDELETKAEVIAVYKDGEPQDNASEGEKAVLYLDQTPFYAESGGQVADNGYITNDSFEADVVDVQKKDGIYAHSVVIKKGSVANGDSVVCNVNIYKRNSTARNHTATHLLQKALREVLGDHVEQAGSKNDENMLRFDFTHFEAMTQEQLDKVETIVNQKITEFLPVVTKVMDKEEAEKTGAMMLFGEKYGDKVRVVNAGDWSIEFCAGTHVKNTGEIGALRIVSESGVAAGVRRIEAVTGMGVLAREKHCESLIEQTAGIMKTNPENIAARAEQLNGELKDVKSELAQKMKQEISADADSLISGAEEVNGVKLITKSFKGAKADDLRDLTDKVKAGTGSVVTAFASDNDGKVVLIVSVSDDLTSKFNAGKIVKEAASLVKGGGGGRADMAQAGGKDPSGIDAALAKVRDIISGN